MLGAKGPARRGGEVGRVLRGQWRAFALAGGFSVVVSVLLLAPAIFSMQVYDRVLGSQSVETLIGLSLIAFFAYAVQGVLDGYRNGSVSP